VDRGRGAYILALLIIVLAVSVPGYGFAHPGGFDSVGGHKDKDTGAYHRHKKSGKEESPYRAEEVEVEVMRVVDGDTFVATFPNGVVEKIRLRDFNAPERGDKGYNLATNRLKKRIRNKRIKIKVRIHKVRGGYMRGYYGRVLADIVAVVN
jgi:endonuclease YncB( thermonuclease family)